METKKQQIRKRVYEFYRDNESKGKKYTVDHFMEEQISQSTIYRIIDLAEHDSGHIRNPGTGRKDTIIYFEHPSSIIVDLIVS